MIANVHTKTLGPGGSGNRYYYVALAAWPAWSDQNARLERLALWRLWRWADIV